MNIADIKLEIKRLEKTGRDKQVIYWLKVKLRELRQTVTTNTDNQSKALVARLKRLEESI